MSVKEETLEKAENKVIEKEKNSEKSQRYYEYSPDVDIYSSKDAFYLEANVPGVSEKDLDISIEKNILTIKGKTELENPEDYKLKFAEYYPGNFKRSFHLSEEVNFDAIEAVVKNGVLRLKLPLKEAISKKIQVKSE